MTIAVIRIRGDVKVNQKIKETLYRMRLRKKYACVLLKPTGENIGMIKKAHGFIAYGDISAEMMAKLIEKRGKMLNKGQKIDSKKLAEEIINGKSMEELKLKPFFRLHPPRKGIESKIPFPKGSLGNNKEKINDLIERML